MIQTLIQLATSDKSQLVERRAAWGLGYLHNLSQADQRSELVKCLANGFRKYGDACQRADAAYGWRMFGNALLLCNKQGTEQLEAMRSQQQDQWLAWLAFEAVYLRHRNMKMSLISEQEAIRQHEKFAPPFPGYRS